MYLASVHVFLGVFFYITTKIVQKMYNILCYEYGTNRAVLRKLVRIWFLKMMRRYRA